MAVLSFNWRTEFKGIGDDWMYNTPNAALESACMYTFSIQTFKIVGRNFTILILRANSSEKMKAIEKRSRIHNIKYLNPLTVV